VLSALERLVVQGLVERIEAGSGFQYTLNRDHLATPAVEALTGMRRALWERLRCVVADWNPPATHVSVFGSAARGEGDVASDIDILIVRLDGLDSEDSSWQAQIAELAERVRLWTGNHAGIAEIGESELPGLAQERPALADNLRADAVTITGPGVAELLEGS
jgi:predicted nucleotidyltransferase